MRRGKYWTSSPERKKKAEEKRERRRKRNILNFFRQNGGYIYMAKNGRGTLSIVD